MMVDIVARWYPAATAAVGEFAAGVAEAAGSTTVIGATERAAAESADQLAKIGIQVPTTQGAGR
jgi:hypothetical protein